MDQLSRVRRFTGEESAGGLLIQDAHSCKRAFDLQNFLLRAWEADSPDVAEVEMSGWNQDGERAIREGAYFIWHFRCCSRAGRRTHARTRLAGLRQGRRQCVRQRAAVRGMHEDRAMCGLPTAFAGSFRTGARLVTILSFRVTLRTDIVRADSCSHEGIWSTCAGNV